MTTTALVTLATETCYSCGCVFGMEKGYQRDRIEDHRTFYCPNGHGQAYNGPSEAKLLRERLERAAKREDRLRAQIVHADDQRAAAERSARAQRGVVTRIKRRIANGVCPCCSRTFPNVAAHISDKHPEWNPDDNHG